jgi:predicted RecA/RadA family phage recombinase
MAYDVYANDGKAECCSEGGGRHWTVGQTSGTFDAVNSGDAVKLGNIAGIALVDYNTDTDQMTVDIAGCHEMEVTAKNQDGGNLAVYVGSFIVFDDSANLLKPFDGTHHAGGDVGVGIAMAPIDAGDSDTICVKLYPFPLFTAD